MDVVVLDAPSNLGLRPGPDGTISGVAKLAGAVRAAGLIERLSAVATVTDAGAIPVGPYDISEWVPGAPYNAEAIETFTYALADRVEVSIRPAGYSTTVVLGGDCSILLGPLLALKRVAEPGLVFIDAHSDFRHDDIDAAAGEELAIATGRGGHFLTDLEGRGALVADDQVVMIGVRERDDDLPFREARTAAEALALITADDIWVHLDADVLDPAYLPAVDSPEPGGLSPHELVELLRPLIADSRVRGIDVCIYDPALDTPDEPGAALLADILGRVFDLRTPQ
jgi:arginase